MLWIFDFGFGRMDQGRPAGWMVPMGSLLLLTVAGLLFLQFRIQPGLVISLIGVADGVVAVSFVGSLFSRIRRRGLRAVARGAWWIDLAAICWVSWASVYSLLMLPQPAALAVQGWQKQLLDALFVVSQKLPAAAVVCSVTGIVLGLVRRRPVRGSAMHVVAFFLWSGVMIFGAIALIPARAAWPVRVAEIAALIGIAVLLIAAAVGLLQRRSKAADSDVPDSSA